MEREREPIKSFLDSYLNLPGEKYYRLTQSQIISKIMNDELYGCGVGSFTVPQELRQTKFLEYGAFVCRTVVRYDQLAPRVQRRIQETGRSTVDRTMVSESNEVTDFFYTTDILKCWLRHGVVVVGLQSFYEFKPSNAAQMFIDKITTYRRQATKDERTKQLAALWKLSG